MDLFSSAFDLTAVDFLEQMGVPFHKVGPFEIVDIQLIEKMARAGKSLILSTGMATLCDIDEAAPAPRKSPCSNAPAPTPSLPEAMNLRTIPHLAQAFGVTVGLSDHTMGTAVPVAALALGAPIIKKHFTLSRSIPGPDSAFSLEPHEFKAMVEAVRTAEKALGVVSYGVSADEQKAASSVARCSWSRACVRVKSLPWRISARSAPETVCRPSTFQRRWATRRRATWNGALRSAGS
jgi:N-acetylneuraminate synthase